MQVRITLLDGSTQELPRTDLRAVKPFRAPLQNPRLKSDGLLYEAGRLYPVHGPLPHERDLAGSATERAWLLFGKDSVRVIRGLPQFQDDVAVNIVPRSTPMPKRTAPASLPTVGASAPEPVLSLAPRSEEEEEAQLMAELEDLLKVA